MERRIGRVSYKCMLCGKISEFTVSRIKTENPTEAKEIMLDTIYEAIRNPYSHKFCEDCDKRTLQMEVAWSYAGDALDE